MIQKGVSKKGGSPTIAIRPYAFKSDKKAHEITLREDTGMDKI
jgi:hypothetical protein